METLNKLFAHIEGASFTSSAYILNTLASFTLYAENSPEYQNALESSLSHPTESSEYIYQRIERLLGTEDDGTYMHPYDASIAAYLYLISKLSTAFYAKKVKDLSLPQNTWWSKQMHAIISNSLEEKPLVNRIEIGLENTNIQHNSSNSYRSSTNSDNSQNIGSI
jgi:hypothetical protein